MGDESDEVKDAREMLGAGYDLSGVSIEAPRVTIKRKNGQMVETEEPAWVKFSTDFKGELKAFDVYALKVFIYVGLSINWKSGEAFPGIRKIAEDTGMDKGTAILAVQWLESNGYMTVYRQEGKANTYTPVRFFSIGTVRPDRTPSEEPSGESGELSGQKSEVSGNPPVKMHNKNNKIKPESISPDFSNMSPKEAIKIPTIRLYRFATNHFPGSPTWDYIHRTITAHKLTHDQIHDAFEAWMLKGFRPNNVEGILDWAINGIPQKTYQKGNTNGSHKQNPGQAVQTEHTDADRRLAEQIKAERAAKTV